MLWCVIPSWHMVSGCDTRYLGILPSSPESIYSTDYSFFYPIFNNNLQIKDIDLWSINESSNLNAIEAFYQSLRKGLDKGEALRQSKISQITNADQFHAHPVYWAALTPIGNQNAIFPVFNFTYIFYSVGTMALLGLGFLLFRRRKKKALLTSRI